MLQTRNFKASEVDAHRADMASWHRFVRRREFECVMEALSPGQLFENALELGAGDGGQSETIAKYCRRLTCTELDTQGTNLIGAFEARNIPNVEYQLCDARDLSRFEDSAFDFVFSSNMLEHVEGAEQCLRECRRVLAPGGAMVHTMPSRHWKFWNAAVSLGVHRSAPQIHALSRTHWQEWQVFGVRSWKKRFRQAGLSVTKIRGLPFYFGHGPNPISLIKFGNAAGWYGSVAYFVEKEPG
jgi:ubiquinone/menaquinone biosynthesis C-methylase UbiE